MKTKLRRGLHLAGLLAVGTAALCTQRLSGIAVAGAPTPVPISSCGSIGPGPYRLTTNITLHSPDACFIVAAGTSLDLGNHTIRGGGDNCGVTDGGGDSPNVIVSNGTITNFADGICMLSNGGSEDLTVDNVNLSLNLNTGIYSQSCCNSFSNVVAN